MKWFHVAAFCSAVLGVTASVAASPTLTLPHATLGTPIKYPVVRPTPGPYGDMTPTRATPMLYPDDSKNIRVRLVSPMALPRILQISGRPNGLVLQNVTLKHWADATPVRARAFDLPTVHPNHLIYEVVTTFSSDQQAHGNHWSSGKKTFFLDAETGRIIAIQTIGHMTVNEGVLRARGGTLSAAKRVIGPTFTAAQLLEIRQKKLRLNIVK